MPVIAEAGVSPRTFGSFAEAGVSPRLLAALSKQGISEPVQVQAEAIPALLAGRDVVMEAQTGLGQDPRLSDPSS